MKRIWSSKGTWPMIGELYDELCWETYVLATEAGWSRAANLIEYWNYSVNKRS